MNLQFSLYLDLIRFFAAILVLISHANVRYLSTETLPFSTHGHIAVIFFFVLSGYVIAFVTDLKENRLSLYWASRLSRIYSVVLPVVILTPILDYIGSDIAQLPVIYADTPMDLWGIRLFASLFFANELWFNSIMSFSNTPFWSLCYEMSYYLIFSISVFFSRKIRWWVVGVCCLIIGPKILLLFPVWLMGVFLHRSIGLSKISSVVGWLLFMSSSIALIAWEYFEVTIQISNYLKLYIGSELHSELAFSKYFIGDWVLGILILINFASFRKIGSSFSMILKPFEKTIRYLASFTLTLYLFHQPLINFYGALIAGKKGDLNYFFQTISATLLTIIIIGSLTEHKREGMRKWLRIKLLKCEESSLFQRFLV